CSRVWSYRQTSGFIMKTKHQIPVLAVLLLALPLALAGCGRSDGGGAQGQSCSSDGDCRKSTTCVDGVCQVPECTGTDCKPPPPPPPPPPLGCNSDVDCGSGGRCQLTALTCPPAPRCDPSKVCAAAPPCGQCVYDPPPSACEDLGEGACMADPTCQPIYS